jgi:hypothetical protein
MEFSRSYSGFGQLSLVWKNKKYAYAITVLPVYARPPPTFVYLNQFYETLYVYYAFIYLLIYLHEFKQDNVPIISGY